MAFTIQLNSTFEDFGFFIDLDGTTYRMDFRWNTRMERWTCSLATENREEIVGMRPVFADWPPFSRFRDDRLPKGELIFVDSSGTKIDPAKNDLGNRVTLVYLTAEDLGR